MYLLFAAGCSMAIWMLRYDCKKPLVAHVNDKHATVASVSTDGAWIATGNRTILINNKHVTVI